MTLFTDILSFGGYLAAVALSVGYWLQVWRIHVHKEVRDLSANSYVLFAVAYMLLGIEAVQIDSLLFIIKNGLVLVPTLVIIYQINYHKNDKWTD